MTDNTNLFVLLECAAGYALFNVVAFEEIGALLQNVTDLTRFTRCVQLKAFTPFQNAQEALENANAVSEHAMTGVLQDFLETHMPTSSSKKSSSNSKKKVALGVLDPALATAILEGTQATTNKGFSCRSDDTVREIVRGCRFHLEHFIKGLEGGANTKAQLGLGHAYSRSKVKFNPARSDNMIIQSIALLDQMDKDLNTFAMRVREWYSWHFPELKDIVKDNYMFARCAALIQDKATLLDHHQKDDDDMMQDNDNDETTTTTTKVEGLIQICGDEDTAKTIVMAAKTSMGMDCSAVDMVNIVNFTQRMVKLADYRKELAHYLSDKMGTVAPNLRALLGDTVAARLISKAGSLTNLAKAPASTVQILGAEKALFRALKTKGNTPKYGLIYHSTFIGRADSKNKGRISRYLANKCSIATRIDSFSTDDQPTDAYGQELRKQVEERLTFYETGAAPRKNVDVMAKVAKQLASASASTTTTPKKSKKNKDDDMDVEETTSSKKKKKKKKKDDDSSDEDEEEVSKKKTKKRKVEEETTTEPDTPKSEKKKKKKEASETTPKSEKKKDKKKKKKKSLS